MTALLRACIGLIVWAAVFSLLYAIEGMGCAQGWDVRLLRGTLVAIWLASIALLIVMAARTRRTRDHDLLSRITFWGSVIGLVATVVTGMPVATLSLCL